jgi:hypothetical protein
MLASFTSMDSESDRPRFGNPDSVKRRHALALAFPAFYLFANPILYGCAVHKACP